MNAFPKDDSVPGIRQSVMFSLLWYGVGHITNTYGKISLPENKTRAGESWNADCTALSPPQLHSVLALANSALSPLYGVRKEQQNLFLCFKTGFIQFEHIQNLSFLLFSLYFLHPTSHPSLGHVHPVACWQCFFPFWFFFSSFLSVDSASGVEKWSGDGHHSPLSSTLAWKGHIWHSCLTEATKASKETGALWLTVAWFVSACDLWYCDSVDFNVDPQWFHVRSFEMSHTQSSYSGSESGQVEKEPFQISFWMYMVEVLLKFPV